jgi:hypothetical protein
MAVTFVAESEGDSIPIRMLARSGQPIEHPYWGRVVHDMSGMKLHKGRIPIDYVHGEPIGYLDVFEASNVGLVVAGRLVATEDPADPVHRIVARHHGGVPYEASINFGGDGIRYEFVDEGQSTQVNGFAFEGPGVVIREWPLRGVAVCPYGADMNTESQFRDDAKTFKASAVGPTPSPPAAKPQHRKGFASKLKFGGFRPFGKPAA